MTARAGIGLLAPRPARAIADPARAALAASLRSFGDLSGFVVNARTGTVICGHQRRDCLAELDLGRVRFSAPRRVELFPGGRRRVSREREGLAELPTGARFRVREVDWPAWLEKAANVAANSPLLAGEFTDALPGILADLASAEPALSDALLFAELAEEVGAFDVAAGDLPELPDGEKPPFEQITFVLSSSQAKTVRKALDAAKEAGPFGNTRNRNANGNALARIAEAYRA